MSYMVIEGYDITRYIEQGGFSLSENDLDSSKAGRTLDGVMQRGKVTEKNKAEIKLVPIKEHVLNILLPMLRQQYFTVRTDLFPGKGDLTMEMYCSTRKFEVPIIDTEGNKWYMNCSFNIIQR